MYIDEVGKHFQCGGRWPCLKREGKLESISSQSNRVYNSKTVTMIQIDIFIQMYEDIEDKLKTKKLIILQIDFCFSSNLPAEIKFIFKCRYCTIKSTRTLQPP